MAKKGPKNLELKGMERPRDEELDAAAEDVAEADSKRGKFQEQADEGRERLLGLMRKKGLSVYVTADESLRVELKGGKDKVSVRKYTAPPAPKDKQDDKAAE